MQIKLFKFNNFISIIVLFASPCTFIPSLGSPLFARTYLFISRVRAKEQHQRPDDIAEGKLFFWINGLSGSSSITRLFFLFIIFNFIAV